MPAWCHPGIAIRLLVLLMLVGAGSLWAQEPPTLSETQVKAAFLIKFSRYVDWPADRFTATNSPIIIGVLGKSKVADELEKGVAGRNVNGHDIVFKRLAFGDDFTGCHILFVPASEKHADKILNQLKQTATLTVGETDAFLDNGGIINLASRDERIALEVNLAAASNAHIKISSKLLSVAQVVKGRTN